MKTILLLFEKDHQTAVLGRNRRGVKLVVVRQARSRENSGPICRLPRDGPDHPHLARIAHTFPHALIIGWTSPGSSLPRLGKVLFIFYSFLFFGGTGD
jgi:hypothetical protein